MNNLLYIQDTEVLISNLDSKNDSKQDIVIFLHGFGANKEDLTFVNTMHPFKNTINIFPQGFIKLNNPYSSNSYGWGNYSNQDNKEYCDEMSLSARKIKLLIEDLISTNQNLENKQISIVGFSQGGMIAQLLAFKHFSNINNLILLSTTLPPTTKKHSLNTYINKIFIGHGIHDDIIKISSADEIYELYKKHNYNIDLIKYNIDHTIDIKLFEDLSTYIFKRD